MSFAGSRRPQDFDFDYSEDQPNTPGTPADYAPGTPGTPAYQADTPSPAAGPYTPQPQTPGSTYSPYSHNTPSPAGYQSKRSLTCPRVYFIACCLFYLSVLLRNVHVHVSQYFRKYQANLHVLYINETKTV